MQFQNSDLACWQSQEDEGRGRSLVLKSLACQMGQVLGSAQDRPQVFPCIFHRHHGACVEPWPVREFFKARKGQLTLDSDGACLSRDDIKRLEPSQAVEQGQLPAHRVQGNPPNLVCDVGKLNRKLQVEAARKIPVVVAEDMK